MPSEVDICNLALQRLGAKSISSLTDDSNAARECNRVYAHARDTELRSHPWNFARKRASLAASSTAPAFGYALQYPLPSDYLRVLTTVEQDDFQIEDGNILTDDTAPLKITYIYRQTDPNAFDQTFIDLLVARIALDLVEKITQSKGKAEAAAQRYTEARKEARKINAHERTALEPPQDSWITSRL